jgi:hypothetical protein
VKAGQRTSSASERVIAALGAAAPGAQELQTLLSPEASEFLEPMAKRAEQLTRRHFGRTISLYVPLYLANYCVGGCVYCGFASDRDQPRRRLEKKDLAAEIQALKARGFEDVLLLTGDRTPEAGFRYLRDSVAIAARHFHNVTVESFAMTTEEYAELADAGCTGITLYQERITAENICDVIGKYNVPREFDLLSLDIDGIDWWVLRSLLRVYSPRVFVCELNNSLSATDPLAVVYDPEFIWTPDDYFGASLGAYRMLAESRGYALVHCQPWNAFFVRRELLPPGVEPQVTWAPFRSWSPDPRRRPWHTIAAADLL